ncbi:helicase HerA domain-containing protein [Alishewanella jeotgali]|uniref:Helicase HerA central domain-containing protein n=1 Tax=Alishewanella jeotgali KCTC 22429 TaxID=1129374 RepID=H3ZD91_9ALTE|nr:DUF87 domain-containing protein [Alishewanella jeotgali]EHR41414.1 hypothetical protein AJE_06581 [Alishewanella jeotgali KCTC 22429]
MKNELAVQQDELNNLFAEFDDVVLKNALTQLNFLDILPIQTNLNQVLHDIRVRKLTKIVYNKEEDNLDKFTSVFSTLHSSKSSVILIVKGFKSHVDIYIAMKKQESLNASSGFEAVETLDAAMAGNFPGVDISTNLVNKEIYQLLEPLQGTSVNAIAAVSGVPSLKEGSKELFSQGLEKLIDGLRGREYTVLINATPVSLSQLSHVELAYQKIHTTLSVFEQQQISYSENESLAVGQSLTEGITKTLTNTISDTQTLTSGTSKTETTSQSSTKSDIDIKRAISGAISGAAAGAIGAGSVSGGLTAPAGALVGGITGLGMGLFGASKTSSTSESFGTNESKSVAKSTSESNSEAASSSTTRSDTATKGNAKSLQFTEKNRTITSLLSQIDAQLERLEECKSYGMWNWGAYFLGGRELDVKLGAELYSGILRGESSGLERNVINVWSRAFQPQQFDVLQMYLSQLNHPQFLMPTGYTTDLMASTSLVSTKEMALAMGFPRQSLPGIPVIEAANFARSVLRIDNNPSHSINIGKVSNLGSVDKAQNVNLDIRSLTSHIFVTGSTGAGKSNAIYAILHKLHKDEGIPFLIVEPAKGEYKAIFGGDESVSVFGTNPKFTPLIKLNPFSFPDGIHVMEHIDRLIEILNAVWPMYAAMPAILKEAVELTYERAGWDLLNSECSSEQISYPDFHDLLAVLPEIINKSDYSQEMKGNYSGALITRVKSLTNGYYSTIFQKDEISPEIIFDQSCIIDLSRVGSSETKSLLMGILFLKLNQHRMANATSHNAGLKHITVLEEAHNLFRRTSTEQGQETANLQGKSVEMIANALAEMRTYGEGFIIADQAPGLLDQAVIRNTNTKIILRLPDFDDRNLVGKAARLNEDQIEELARLQTGCAAVFQNNWVEPVLCQFDEFNEELIKPFTYSAPKEKLVDHRKLALVNSIKEILKQSSDLSNFEPFNNDPSSKKVSHLHQRLIEKLNINTLLDQVPMSQNIDIWINWLSDAIFSVVQKNLLTIREQNELVALVLEVLAVESPNNKPYFDAKVSELRHASKELI